MFSSIIEHILATTWRDIEERRARLPARELKRITRDAPRTRSLKDALAPAFSIIAEVKERSPSIGTMNPRNVDEAAAVYEATPCISAISVLTEREHFGGSLEVLSRIRQQSRKPVLRKDFIIDEYQVWEARAAGADAILLMTSLPPFASRPKLLSRLFDLAEDLGMEALCEIGMTTEGETAQEVARRVPKRAPIRGINSRMFKSSKLRFRARLGSFIGKDYMTDTVQHVELRSLIPPHRIAVAESGIETANDLRSVARLGYHAALIGTAFLRGPRSVGQVAAEFGRVVGDIRTDQERTLRAQARSRRAEA